jgi:hypothetical protein
VCGLDIKLKTRTSATFLSINVNKLNELGDESRELPAKLASLDPSYRVEYWQLGYLTSRVVTNFLRSSSRAYTKMSLKDHKS